VYKSTTATEARQTCQTLDSPSDIPTNPPLEQNTPIAPAKGAPTSRLMRGGRPRRVVPLGQRPPLAADVAETPTLGGPAARGRQSRHRALCRDGRRRRQRRSPPSLVGPRLGTAQQSPQGCLDAAREDYERLGPRFHAIPRDPVPRQPRDGAPCLVPQHVPCHWVPWVL